jgi:hypothetical protein
MPDRSSDAIAGQCASYHFHWLVKRIPLR